MSDETMDTDPETICEDVLERSEGSLEGLAAWERVVVMVYSAQGTIDNGGYRFFFEADWPQISGYDDFVQAYREIGCARQAEDLARAANSFGFAEPHLNTALRHAFLEEHVDPETNAVPQWGDDLCGDGEVWERVHAYAARHAGQG